MSDVKWDGRCKDPVPSGSHCWCGVYAGGTRLQCCRCRVWTDNPRQPAEESPQPTEGEAT